MLSRSFNKEAIKEDFYKSLRYEIPGIHLLQIHYEKLKKIKFDANRCALVKKLKESKEKMKAAHPDHGGSNEAFRAAYKEWKQLEAEAEKLNKS